MNDRVVCRKPLMITLNDPLFEAEVDIPVAVFLRARRPCAKA
jgi:hypothetical protein